MTPDLDNTTLESPPTTSESQTETEDTGSEKTDTDFTTREKLHHVIYVAWMKTPLSPIETISVITTYLLIFTATIYFGNGYNAIGLVTLTVAAGLITAYKHEKGVIDPANVIQKTSYIGLICLTVGIGIRYALMGILFEYPI